MFTVKKFLSLSVLFAAQNILVGADQVSVEKEVNELYNTFSSWKSLEEKKAFFLSLTTNINSLNSTHAGEYYANHARKAFNSGDDIVKNLPSLSIQISRCEEYKNSCYTQSIGYLLASIGSLWGGFFIPSYTEIFIPSLKTTTFSSCSIDKLSLAVGSSLAFLLLGAAGYKYIHYRSLRKAVESEEFGALQEKAFRPTIGLIHRTN